MVAGLSQLTTDGPHQKNEHIGWLWKQLKITYSFLLGGDL